MREERELIKDMMVLLECMDSGGLQRQADKLIGRAIELLAQPETEQEPKAWLYEYAVGSSFDASFTGEWKEAISRTKPDGTAKWYPTNFESTIRNLVPLYTSPPKREPPQTAREFYQRGDLKRDPVSDEEIIARYKAIDIENALYAPTYYAGFRDAEKAYGITGGGE
jgi:hypothetical protein